MVRRARLHHPARPDDRPRRTRRRAHVLRSALPRGPLPRRARAPQPDRPRRRDRRSLPPDHRIISPQLVDANRELHEYLVNGISIEYARPDGTIGYDPVRLVDYDDPDNNDWLVVNQFTFTENGHTRRPDLVVFVNGLPVAVIELKNAASESTTIWSAYAQLETYKAQLPALFVFNELLVVSDGADARVGTLSSNKERFLPWRTIEGEALAPASISRLEVLLRGAFDRRRFLDLVRYFVVFEHDGQSNTKKVAGYHQFHAVANAVDATVRAAQAHG